LRLTRTGRAVRLVQGNSTFPEGGTPDPTLVQLVSRAHRWWAMIREQDIGPAELARREGVTVSYVSRVLRLAFLSPPVIDAILDGKQRASVDGTMMLRHDAIAREWDLQEKRFLPR
jgi:hypothetical protein